MPANQGLVPALEQFFYDQGKVYTKAEVLALLATGSAAPQGAIFKVYNSDPSYVQSGNDVVITDIRLIGESGYPVKASQHGGAPFPDTDLTYNPTLGTVTIASFTLLNNEFIEIDAIGLVATTGFGTVLARLAALEELTAPDDIGAIKIWPWKDSERSIPTGWVEFLQWTGRVMVPSNASDAIFQVVRNIGGANAITLTENNLPELSFKLFGSSVNTSNGDLPGADDPVARARSNGDNDSSSRLNYEMAKSGASDPTLGRTNKRGKASPDPISTIQAYVNIRLIIRVGVTIP